MAATRLAKRLREHDWFAAAIEVLIVIVGILIALQVSNWNEDRQDRARARQYAQRLHGELQTDLANMASARRFWGQVAGYQAQASDYAENGQLAGDSAWRTVLAYYQASQLRLVEVLAAAQGRRPGADRLPFADSGRRGGSDPGALPRHARPDREPALLAGADARQPADRFRRRAAGARAGRSRASDHAAGQLVS